MTYSNRLSKHFADKRKLKNMLLGMLRHSTKWIVNQGTGCNIPGLGASYTYNTLRCNIACLMPSGSKVRNDSFGPISSIEQNYIVTRIMTRFGFRPEHRSELKSFLQKMQDIHDAAFDQYNHVEGDRMKFFLGKIAELESTLDAN